MDPDDPIFDELDGKYIMVGQIVTSEPYGEIDRVQTIVGDIKGVEVHARILDSLLNENYFVQMGPVARYASVVTTVLLTLANSRCTGNLKVTWFASLDWSSFLESFILALCFCFPIAWSF